MFASAKVRILILWAQSGEKIITLLHEILLNPIWIGYFCHESNILICAVIVAIDEIVSFLHLATCGNPRRTFTVINVNVER